MNEPQTDRMLALLGSIADSLSRLAGETDGDSAPDWVWPISMYPTFDWAGAGCQVITRDADGPTVVQHQGKNYKRRSPDNAYTPAIWYSRCVGKDSEGRNEYVRLVTFSEFNEDDILPIGRKVERSLRNAPSAPVAPLQPAPIRQAPSAASAPQRPATPTQTGSQSQGDIDQLFDDMPSASAGLVIAPVVAPPAGPIVSAGAAPEGAPLAIQQPRLPVSQVQGGCPNCGKSIEHDNPACPNHRAPVIGHAAPRPAGSVSQATVGAGRVGAEFRVWCADFARRYPKYRLSSRDESADMYHIQMTVGSFGIAKIEMENLAEVKAQLEAHAAAAVIVALTPA